MNIEDIWNIDNLYRMNRTTKEASDELKLPESDVIAVYLKIREHEKNLRKRPLYKI